MSAARMIHRREWRDGQVTAATYMRTVDRAKPDPQSGALVLPSWHTYVLPSWHTYHEHEIAQGRRHAKFQARKRFVRAQHGFSPASSHMHSVHGRAC